MKFTYRTLAVAVAAALVVPTQATFAQDKNLTEEVVVIGTRTEGRSALDSPAPVDVIGGETMSNQGDTDMSNLLRNVVPSYNVNDQPISDAATLVRPANLRGLPPDNILVLVNGKRRHRSGVIAELGGSLSAGSQGADISAIPAMAFRQTEILRDGAAAQYGSDAIAGVINFVLKDDPDGFSLEARTGEFGEGDGTMTQFMGNVGLPLGDDGFANITASWMEQDPTSRSTQRTDAATLIASGTEVSGRITFSGSLEVEGTVHGDVIAAEGCDTAQVRVQNSGKIIGDVCAPVVIVNSSIEGNVHSSKRVELAPQAVVCGDIHYQVIEMVKGAQINGELVYTNEVSRVLSQGAGEAAGKATAEEETGLA